MLKPILEKSEKLSIQLVPFGEERVNGIAFKTI